MRKENQSLLLIILILLSGILLLFSSVRSGLIGIATKIFNTTLSYKYWKLFLKQFSFAFLLSGAVTLLFFIDSQRNGGKFLSWINEVISTRKWVKFFVILLAWITIITLFGQKNLTNPNFWYDESGQFWIAKGLNHNSPKYAPAGSLIDMVENNNTHNLDPGGFSLLLRAWTSIGTNPVILRLLPFSFFILSMIFISIIALSWQPKYFWVNFAGFILLFSGLLKYYAFELRPYSMEVLTSVFSLYCYIKSDDVLRNSYSAFAYGSILAILMTSRYSSFLSVGALALLLGIETLKARKRSSFKTFLPFIFPITIVALLVYFLILKNQNPELASPDYVNQFLLSQGSVKEIFINLKAISIYLPFVILLGISILYKAENDEIGFKKYLIFSLVINSIFAILSLLGFYTWAFITKWDISTHTILLISLIPLTMLTINLVKRMPVFSFIPNTMITVLLVSSSVFLANQYSYPDFGSILDNFYECGVLDSDDARVVATGYASPTIRYLFEYGPLKKHQEIYRLLDLPYATETISKHFSYYDNNFEYIILPHWVNNTHELVSKMTDSGRWSQCSTNEYSQMYKKTIDQ